MVPAALSAGDKPEGAMLTVKNTSATLSRMGHPPGTRLS